jgi:hypothetical protein
MAESSIIGGCLCGAVRYRSTAAPRALSLCHCRSCRRASGAPSVAWAVFAAEHFAFTTGQPVAFNSSPGVERTFCGRCGTPLTWQRGTEADTIDVTTASLDSPDDFAPTKEIWIEHAIAWEALNPATEHYPRSSVGA